MASITPYPSGHNAIAALPLYTPDFSTIAADLQKRNYLFDQGLNQIKSSYNSILSAPLLAKGNAEVRDEYLKQAQTKLKDIASFDLSQQQNVQSAQQIFSPFWQDQDLLQDYSKSSQIIANQKKAAMLAESSDPKMREQYWQMGADFVNISARKMQNASRGDGSIGKVQVNKYVPFFDVMKELDARAKEQGFKVESETLDPTGRYKIKTVNGDKSIPNYTEWVSHQLATMPQAKEIFRVEGAVQYDNLTQSYLSQGMPEAQAKDLAATNFISRDLEATKARFTDVSEQAQKLKSELDAKNAAYTANPGVVTAEQTKEFKTLSDQYKRLSQSASDYEQKVNSLGDKNSKLYQDLYTNITKGGEAYFSNIAENNFITRFARSRAAAVQSSYSLDDVAKIQLEAEANQIKFDQELQKIDYKERLKGGSGSKSGSSGSSEDGSDGEGFGALDINTPTYVGLNTKGLDIIATKKRFTDIKLSRLHEGIDQAASIIVTANAYNTNKDAVKIAPALIEAYRSGLKNGVFNTKNPDPEVLAEYKRLQEKGLIDKNIAYGQSPTATFNKLFENAKRFIIARKDTGGLSESDMNKIERYESNMTTYGNLVKAETDIHSSVLKDPMFAPLSKGGKLMSKNEFLKARFGYSNADEYAKTITNTASGVPQSLVMGTVVPVYTSAKDRAVATFKEAGKQYDKLLESFDERASGQLKNVLGGDSYIGSMQIFRTDRIKETDVAQNIVDQAMSEDNLGETGGIPTNLKQLVEQGADEDELKNIIQLTKGPTARNVINAVGLTKIGAAGGAAVKVFFDRAEVVKLLGGENSLNDEQKATLKAINDGVEIAVKKGSVSGFNTDWEPAAVDFLNFDKSGELKSSNWLKELGVEWTLTKDTAGNQLIASVSYQEADKTGNMHTKHESLMMPISKNIGSIRQELNSIALGSIRKNQKVLSNLGVDPTQTWEQRKQSLGITY
jgi:hypothetical protein